MYYKAEISVATEKLWINPKSGDYEGCDPETYQDHGTIQVITKPSLDAIKEELHRQYGLKNAELYDGLITVSYDGEHDYRIPFEERVPFIETMTIAITKVEETLLNDLELMLFLKQWTK